MGTKKVRKRQAKRRAGLSSRPDSRALIEKLGVFGSITALQLMEKDAEALLCGHPIGSGGVCVGAPGYQFRPADYCYPGSAADFYCWT